MKKFFFVFAIILFIGMTLRAQTVNDADGNEYKTVIIGKQTWMVENLRTTKFNDSIRIPLVTDGELENLTTPCYCWYDNNEANKNPYGALYNWHSVNSNKLCPVGWHISKSIDWSVLYNYLGSDYFGGNKLMESGTVHWLKDDKFPEGNSNETGFTAIPAGHFNRGKFMDIGVDAMWWMPDGKYRNIILGKMGNIYAGTFLNSTFDSDDKSNQGNAFSVRCIKD